MFHSARLKLTAWYMLIIFFVSMFFSITVYRVLTFEIDRFVIMQKTKMERRMRDPNFLPYELSRRFPTPPVAFAIDMALVGETKTRIALSLLIVDASIIVISGLLAYFLAGKTLGPIAGMLEEQKRFVGDTSHELRTPLTALKSAIEVNLRDKKLTLQDAKDLLVNAKDQVDRLTHLSNSLLELSRHDSKELSRGVEKVNLTDVAKKVAEEMQPLAAEKNCSIVLEAVEANVGMSGDDVRRVISILVDNAIKYSKPDMQVKVSVSKVKKCVVLKVEDQGIGISSQDMKHVFDRFFRADTARSKQSADGYGLGLAIAKKIVDAYKGKILVSSVEGKGSVFTVMMSSA